MTTFQPVHSISRTQKLILGLKRIIATRLSLPLVPIGNNKQPLGVRWQQRPFTATKLIEAISDGGVEVPIKDQTKKIHPLGFGLITGREVTIQGNIHFLMALDQDGASACRKIDELSGGKPLPKTVAFTSGRPGRCQYLFLIPEKYKNSIKTKKIKTGVIGDDGKAEQLEFRWSNLQSVLPPSVHPTTGEYRWVDGCAIDETEIALAPDWIIEQMLIEQGSKGAGEQGGRGVTTAGFSSTPTHRRTDAPLQGKWTDRDYALSYLDALSIHRADNYDEWLAVGMALHSIDEDLLDSWDKWSNQSAKYKLGECAKKWRSFTTGGGVTLGTLAHMAKQDGWVSPFAKENKQNNYSNNHNNSSRDAAKKSTVTGDTTQQGDTSKQVILSLEQTVTTVTDVLKAGLTDYSERDKLDSIQLRSVMSKAAFWQMVAAFRTNLDEIQPEDTDKFNRLIDWNNATLDFKLILPQPLADAFNHDAAILNIDPVSLWQYFFPAVLSLAGKRVSLDVESHSIPALAWTCIVGESGTGKSRAESVILSNLKQKQHREKKRWLEQMGEYKQITQKKGKDDNAEISPPAPERKYLFEVATIQAVMRRLSEQHENGSIWARDEIAGLFKSLGQFQGKKGDNEGLECLLKMWDGSGSFVDRVNAFTDSYAVPETRLSIAGGIQPGAFRAAFKDPHDAQGLQARFLYAIPKVFPARRVKGYCQLSDILPDLYDWLDRCPVGTIKLSTEADRRYSNLVEQIGFQAEQSSCPAVRAWMRKLPTQLLRIALALHLVEYYYNHAVSFGELQQDTLERAVEICRYYRSAFAVVQEKITDSDNPSSILLKIWDMATIKPDGVTPRDIYRSIKAIGRRAKAIGCSVSAYTLELITKLVRMGKGTIEKNGRSIRFVANSNPPNNPTPTTPIQDEHNSSTPVENQRKSDNSSKSVTGVTSHRCNQSQQEEPSPPIDVSPVTSTNSPETDNSSCRDLNPNNSSGNNAPNNNSSKSVTEVTQAQCNQSQQEEPSPPRDVSPVTSTNSPETVRVEKSDLNPNNSSPNENISWLLQFLADLEFTPAPHPRFTSLKQLQNLFKELELRVKDCQEELLKLYPDYSDRVISAFSAVIDCFPLSSLELESNRAECQIED